MSDSGIVVIMAGIVLFLAVMISANQFFSFDEGKKEWSAACISKGGVPVASSIREIKTLTHYGDVICARIEVIDIVEENKGSKR